MQKEGTIKLVELCAERYNWIAAFCAELIV